MRNGHVHRRCRRPMTEANMRRASLVCPSYAGFIALLTVWSAGCGLTVRKARLETPDTIGTTYWGPVVDGLRAGLAIERPGGGDGQKARVPWQSPGVCLLCKLQNTSDHP